MGEKNIMTITGQVFASLDCNCATRFVSGRLSENARPRSYLTTYDYFRRDSVRGSLRTSEHFTNREIRNLKCL